MVMFMAASSEQRPVRRGVRAKMRPKLLMHGISHWFKRDSPKLVDLLLISGIASPARRIYFALRHLKSDQLNFTRRVPS